MIHILIKEQYEYCSLAQAVLFFSIKQRNVTSFVTLNMIYFIVKLCIFIVR